MPRENRKRGKKNKGKRDEQAQEEETHEDDHHFVAEDAQGTHSAPGIDAECSSPSDATFGPLDPDVKAYFRIVDDQLRDWQDERLNTDVEQDVDPNEERRMFFTAALSEMNGKELQLATDPDCSPVLERMLYSMDDFVRRVFADSLAGSWLQLVTDRFASHVCQTLFTVAAETVARETRGSLPTAPSSEGRGELLTMTQLILNACEDIVPELPGLIQDPFASHVLRALLILLAPSQLAPPPSRSHKHAPSARSKKSASWKARHGPMKPVILDEPSQSNHGTTAPSTGLTRPDSFSTITGRFVGQIRSVLGGNEVRALAVDKVGSPVLQMLLELETALGQADAADSIMDRVLAGLITESITAVVSSPSSYVSARLLDTTSSHLSESILSRSSPRVFYRIWDCYFSSDLPKLAAHPVANFVVARGVERLDEGRLRDAVTQLHATWSKTLRFARMGVLIAMVDRAGQLGTHEADLVETLCSMVELNTDEERKLLVPCVLRLKTLGEYQDALTRKETAQNGDSCLSKEPQGFKRNDRGKQEHDTLDPKTQGSILVQSLLRLREPHNNIVLDSLYSLLPTELLTLAYNATSSRVLDAALESPTVSLRSRKRVVTSFMGHFHLLVDDRIGSRVADRCWEAADPYLKEKIARSLIPHEQFLAGSHFGRFFARNLALPLLQRKPDQWKALQSTDKKLLTDANAIPNARLKFPHHSAAEAETATVSTHSGSKRKRKEVTGGDEIDELFSGIGAKKRAKGLAEVPTDAGVSIGKGDATLDVVLGAIRSAPDPKPRRSKK